MKSAVVGVILILAGPTAAASAQAAKPPLTPDAVLIATWSNEVRTQDGLLAQANWNGHQYSADNIFEAPKAMRVAAESDLAVSITKSELPDEATIWVWTNVNRYGVPRERPARYDCSLAPVPGGGCNIVLELTESGIEWKLALNLAHPGSAYIATTVAWGNERLAWNNHLHFG